MFFAGALRARVFTALLFSAFLALPACFANAAPAAILTWDANLEPDIAGYKVHSGRNPRSYTSIADVGIATTNLLTDLVPGATYYFAVTAYNTSGLESDLSEEVSFAVPAGNTLGLLSSSANPALPGAEVSFTFTVSALGLAEIPTGLAIFKIDGIATTVPLVDGTAVLSTSTLSPGIHRVEAEYLGDLLFDRFATRLTADQLINTPPLAQGDTIYRVSPNSVKVQLATLLTNDVDLDGHPLTLLSVSSPTANGATVSRRSNWIYYIAPEGFTNEDSFTYTINDGYGQPVTGTVQVRVANPEPAPNVTISENEGFYRVRFDGTPGLTYRIEYAETQNSPTWQTLESRTADQFGIFEIIDTPPPGTPQRFYRSIVMN